MTQDDFDVVYRYTRAQAIDDGVLIDLTDLAKETGFRIPVACTAAVWHEYIVPSEELEEPGQSERGRAHDMLWILFNAIRQADADTDRLLFKVIFLMPSQCRGRRECRDTGTLNSLCGPGDEGEPVLTILLPSED